jgi:hypothetical protein
MKRFIISSRVIRMIKSRRMRSAGHAARMGEMRNAYKIWLQCLSRKGYKQDLGLHKKMILK